MVVMVVGGRVGDERGCKGAILATICVHLNKKAYLVLPLINKFLKLFAREIMVN